MKISNRLILMAGITVAFSAMGFNQYSNAETIYDRLRALSGGSKEVGKETGSVVSLGVQSQDTGSKQPSSGGATPSDTAQIILGGSDDNITASPISQNTITPTSNTSINKAIPDDCDPEVFKALVDENKKSVERQISMRERPAPGNVNEYDCLDSILDVNLGGFFNFPNPLDVFENLKKGACNKVRETVSDGLGQTEQMQISTPGIDLPFGVYAEGASIGGSSLSQTSNSYNGSSNSSSGTGSWNDLRTNIRSSLSLPAVAGGQ